MTQDNKKLTIGIDSIIKTPAEEIPGQAVNPDPMPRYTPDIQDDLRAVEITETDISCVQVADIDTVQLTMGSLRPMQGYTPLGDIPRAKEANATSGVSDLLVVPIETEADQLSISLVSRGVNGINPLSLPPLRAGDISGTGIDSAKVEALYFGNNGPSIATPGSAKRAAVEQSMMTMKSQITNAFNRDIAFSSMSLAERTLALKAYETELLKIQLFFQTLDRLRGYAAFQAKLDVPLDQSWEVLYHPDIYTSLVALYNIVADLPVFDEASHIRLEKLGRIFTAAKRTATPGTCFMQDIYIAEDRYKEGLELAGQGQYSYAKVPLDQCVPNLPMSLLAREILTDRDHAVAMIQSFALAIKSVRKNYETVITALAQMTSKRALATKPLSDFIPAKVTDLGVLDFGSTEPAFSYAAHERFEYAPFWVSEEAGPLGAAVAGYWTLAQLPDTDIRDLPSRCVGIRPVGLRHGKQAWKIAELIDMGLFKRQGAAEVAADGYYTSRLEASSYVYSSGTYTIAAKELWDGTTDIRQAVVDAVFGDFFWGGIAFKDSSDGVGFNGWAMILHGLSFFAPGTGIHNSLPVPFKLPTTSAGLPGINAVADDGCALFSACAASEANQDMRGFEWFMDQVATQVCLSNLFAACDNASGQRQLVKMIQRGYKDSGYYSFSISAVDNAVAKAYLSLVPFVEYTPRKA